MNVVLVASQSGNVGHTGIHVGSTHSVTNGLVLLDDGLMSLRVVVNDSGLSTIVEQELRFVEVLLLACYQIELGQCHLSNLMTGHHTGLSRIRAYLAADAVGIAAGNVEELRRPRCLPVSNGCFHHVAEVIKLVREVFLFHPTLAASPLMRVVRVLCASGIEIAVGFLCGSDDVEHRVYIGLQLLVGIGLQDIRCALDGLVGIGVVERITAHLENL